MGFVATIPFWALCIIVGLYFFKRKPNNNLRYSSPRYMPEKRKQYIAKLKKYVGVVSVSIGDIILPNFFLISTFRVVGYASFFLWKFISLYPATSFYNLPYCSRIFGMVSSPIFLW